MFLFVSFRKSCESPQISESFGKNPVSEKPWEAFLGSYQMIYKDFASNNLSEICFHWWADECLSSSKKGLCSVPETSECLVCLLLNIHHILTRTLPRPYMMCHVYIYIYTCVYMNRLHICSMVIWHWKVFWFLGSLDWDQCESQVAFVWDPDVLTTHSPSSQC